MLLLAAGALAVSAGLTGGTHARTLTSAQRYAAFDWMAHWYPMAWTRDLPVDRPTRVTLFDDDYAVVLRSDGQPPLALRDACPHRLAALSEGRLTEQGFLQCAYHGWAFDDSGACKAIPQLPAGGSLASACTRAATAVVSQGILWLHPAPRGTAPLPEVPRVPEMDDDRYKWSPAVRDLPIDYSLLVENILDPDHGLFAHQLPAFDLYSASPDAPQRVTVRAVEDEAEDEAAAFAIESRVAAWAKLTRRQAESAGSTAVRTAYAAASADTPQLEASSTFRPPAVIVSCRRDGAGASSFLTCFFLSPTGVGRTRFMAVRASHRADRKAKPPPLFVTPSRSSVARRASAAASPSRCLAGCSTWASTTSSTRTLSSSRRSSRTCCGRSSSAVTRLRRQRRRRHVQRLPRTARRRRPRASSSLCGERCTSSAR